MGILNMATADLQDLSVLNNEVFGTSISSDYARTGTYSFKIAYNGNCSISLNGTNTYYVKFAMLSTSDLNPNRCYFSTPGATYTNYQWYALISPASIGIYRYSGVLLDTQTISLNAGWNLFEIYTVIHDTTGIIQIKINDTLEVNLSGIDNRGSAVTDESDRCVLYCANSPGYLYMDDIMVRDDDWCGPGGLHILSPSGAGTTEDWVASSGDPEDCVDEIPMTFDDYISTPGNIPSTQHLFEIESLPGSSAIVGGVGIFAKIVSDETTDARARVMIDSNGTQDAGSGVLVQTSEGWATGYWLLNPDDAADWETADIDALQIGVETE